MTASHATERDAPLVLAAGSMLDQPAEAVLEAAAAAGFDGVGLRLSAQHAVRDPDAIRARAQQLGLAIHDCEVYRIGDDTADTPDPAALIEASAGVGASALLVVSDLTDRTATIRAVADLVARCETYGLRVGLEYMAWTCPNAPLDAIAIAGETGCVVIVDLLHHVRVGAGLDELDAIVASGRLGWVQLCDAPSAPPPASGEGGLIAEARHGRLPPGQGRLPLRALLARLPADATISVEVQSDVQLGTPPPERARLLLAAARAVLGRSDQSPSRTG